MLQLDVITENLSKQVMEHHEEMGMLCTFVLLFLADFETLYICLLLQLVKVKQVVFADVFTS